jgi:hypothetical protein
LLDDQGMGHTRGAPYHPTTKGKIERWHRSMKNQVLLDNYYLPGELKARNGAFGDYYNTGRYHENLKNLTPEDDYTDRGQTVLNRRRRIKLKRWPNDVGYASNAKLLNHETDDPEVSLKSGSLQPENL